jgi:hypothetical protein
MASTEDDYYRYIEYLQRQTLDEDWSPAFDSSKWKSWIVKNRARLEKMAQCPLGADGPSLVADLERSVHEFKPTTAFEMPTTKAIFEPVLVEVTKAAATIGINPVRSIEIVTSPIPVHLRRAGPRQQITSCLLGWARPVSVTIGRNASQP